MGPDPLGTEFESLGLHNGLHIRFHRLSCHGLDLPRHRPAKEAIPTNNPKAMPISFFD